MTRPRLRQIDFDTSTVTTTPTTLGPAHGFVRVDSTAGNITINLPAAASNTDKVFWIVKVVAANSVIVDANGAELINGAATYTISDQWGGAIFACNGTTWTAISGGIDVHDAVTLDADAAVLLDLTGQEIGLDTQTANTVLAGPTTGAANEPTFRALVEADIDEILPLAGLSDVDTTGTATGDIIYNTGAGWEDYPLNIGTNVINDGTELQLGNVSGGNYVAISDTSGEVTLVGDARQWDDLQVTVVIRNTGATTRDPTFTKWFDNGAGSRGVYVYGFGDEGVNEKELTFTMQMAHRQVPTEAIHMHVHWIGDTTADPAVVKWGLEYTWKSPLEVFGNTTIVYATALENDAATGITQYKHNITEFTALTPGVTQDDLSSILIGRLFRNSSHADDTYTGGVAGLLAIDAHVLIDSFGSAEEYTKYEDIADNLLLESGDAILLENGDLILLEA